MHPPKIFFILVRLEATKIDKFNTSRFMQSLNIPCKLITEVLLKMGKSKEDKDEQPLNISSIYTIFETSKKEILIDFKYEHL